MSERRWTGEQYRAAQLIRFANEKIRWGEPIDQACAEIAKHAHLFFAPADESHRLLVAARAESDALRRELAEANRTLNLPHIQTKDRPEHWTREIQNAVARAVAAEREACAKIADGYVGDAIGSGCALCCRNVAASIRCRPPAPAGGAQETEHAVVPSEGEPQRQGVQAESSAQAPAPEREVVGMKPAAGGGSNAQASPSSAVSAQAPDSDKPRVYTPDTSEWHFHNPLATEARVRTLIAEYVAEWTQQDLAWMHTTDARLSALEHSMQDVRFEFQQQGIEISALESQQETARGEKNTSEKAADSENGSTIAVQPGELPAQASPSESAAPPSPQPMTEIQLAEALKAYDNKHNEGFFGLAREARRLLAQEGDETVGDVIAAQADGAIVLDDGITTWNARRACAFLRENGDRLAKRAELAESERDKLRVRVAEKERCINRTLDNLGRAAIERDTLRAQHEKQREAITGLTARNDTLRARVAELEAIQEADHEQLRLKTTMAVESAISDLVDEDNDLGLLEDERPQIRTILAKYVTPAKPARRISPDDMEAAKGAYLRDGAPRQWAEFYAAALNDFLSSRGDDKPQARTIEGE